MFILFGTFLIIFGTTTTTCFVWNVMWSLSPWYRHIHTNYSCVHVTLKTDMSHVTQTYRSSAVWPIYPMCLVYGPYTQCVWCMAHIPNVSGTPCDPKCLTSVWPIHPMCLVSSPYIQYVWCLAHTYNVSGVWPIHTMCLVSGPYIQCVWYMAHIPNVSDVWSIHTMCLVHPVTLCVWPVYGPYT